MNKLTNKVGMFFFREAGKHADGTDLMMVIGIVPKKALSKEIKGERQYPVVVVDDHMYIHRAYPTDLTKEARGLTADQLLTGPFWKIG